MGKSSSIVYSSVKEIMTKIYTSSHRQLNDDEVSVTELTTCLRKSYLDRVVKLTPPVDILQRIIFGTGLHLAFKTVMPEAEREYRKKIGDAELVGVPDCVMNDTIYEWKTSLTIPPAPSMHHLAQVSGYMYLTDLSKAVIFYLTPKGRQQAFIVQRSQLTDKLTEKLLSRMTMYLKHVRGGGMPEPEFDWTCQNCPYVKLYCLGHEVVKA